MRKNEILAVFATLILISTSLTSLVSESVGADEADDIDQFENIINDDPTTVIGGGQIVIHTN